MATTPRTARAVQVPGEPTQEQATTETVDTSTQEQATGETVDTSTQEQATGAGVVDDGAPEPNAAAETDNEVAQLRAQLEAERIARIEAEQRAAQAQAQAQAATSGADRVVQADPTPEPVATLQPGQSAKLTGSGWVVPATYGSPIKVA